MLGLLLLLSLCTQTFADVVLYEKNWSDEDPRVARESWYWVDSAHSGGDYIVVDSYQTRASTQADTTSIDAGRLVQWAFKQMHHLAEEGSKGKPVYLDVSVVEKKTTRGSGDHGTQFEVAEEENNSEVERNAFRHTALLTLLFITCVASWVLFFVQASRLAKRIRKRQQRKLKKMKSKKKTNELKVPLLGHEGTMK